METICKVKCQELDETEVGSDCNGQPNYGLRENPKKSSKGFGKKRRVLKYQYVCEQCVKGFKSDKALFGHMRLHSGLRKGKFKTAFKGHCDYLIPSPVRKKRSQRRYENLDSSCSNFNESSCVCSDDDEELKDIALSLLMLSKGGFYSGPGSSEINSVHLGPTLRVHDDHDDMRNCCEIQSVNAFVGKEVGEFCGCDDGFVSTDHEMVDVDVSVENVEFKKSHLGNSIDFELHDSEMLDHNKNLVLNELGIKGSNLDVCVSITEGASLDTHIREIEMNTDTDKNSGIHCEICGKVFQSRNALRGHRLHCPVKRKCYAKKPPRAAVCSETNDKRAVCESSSAVECNEIILVDTEVCEKAESSNKVMRQWKDHVCSICSKAFLSGRALGGHMRAHYRSIDKTELIQNQKHNGLKEVNDHAEPKPCWYETGLQHEPPVMLGLVSH